MVRANHGFTPRTMPAHSSGHFVSFHWRERTAWRRPGHQGPQQIRPQAPLSNDLQTTVQDGFRLVAVGDCIISRPLSQYAKREAEFEKALVVLQSGEATYGNLETSILDIGSFKGFPYTGVDDVPLLAEPLVAKDLLAMGFKVMSRANNHALDWGIEGMRETTH